MSGKLIKNHSSVAPDTLDNLDASDTLILRMNLILLMLPNLHMLRESCIEWVLGSHNASAPSCQQTWNYNVIKNTYYQIYSPIYMLNCPGDLTASLLQQYPSGTVISRSILGWNNIPLNKIQNYRDQNYQSRIKKMAILCVQTKIFSLSLNMR